MNSKKPKKVDYKNSWKNWGEDFKKIGASSRHTRRKIKDFMRGIKFDSIIDIGCGTGIFLESLNLKNKKVAGIDISDSGIMICKEKMKKGKFQVMDLEKEIPKVLYDLGICSEVLEHIKDDVKAIKNLRNLCRQVIISVPCGKYGKDDKIQGHFRRYTEKELYMKLEKAGFNIIKHEKWGFPFYSPIYRFLINASKEENRTGKVTFFKFVISELFYLFFFLNIKNMGDRLFVLAN